MNEKRKNFPSAPLYQYKPFHMHIDLGFGAMAEAFNDAAVSLDNITKDKRFANSPIPIAYLYRHSVELFLKSCTIILHIGLKIPFENHPKSKTAIKIKQGIVPIECTHSVKILFNYFYKLLQDQIEQLSNLTNTDWDTIPAELEKWITEIDNFDAKSIVFRYPGPKDEAKSDFRNSTISEIFSLMGPDDEPVKAHLELNEIDEVSNAYILDSSALKPIVEILHKTSDTLSTLHFALRSELGDGN